MRFKRFGLSDTQIEALRDGAEDGDIMVNRRVTGEKLLELGMVKKVASLDEREKAWKDAKIEGLRVRALKHLKAGRVKQAYSILDDAISVLDDRDEMRTVLTEKGKIVLASIEAAEEAAEAKLKAESTAKLARELAEQLK
jgi:hypothetical protein